MLYPDFDELVALKDRKSKVALASRRSVKTTIAGDHHSPFRGQGLEFDAVREYVPGDDIRAIDWRVTARKGAAHTKLFKEERERSVIISVDMNATMRFGTRNTFKSVQAARAAALLGWQSLSQHNRVGACLFGDVTDGIQFFAPKRTRKSLWAMLKLLTNPPEKQHLISLEEVLQQINRVAQTGSLIYLISDFIDLSDHLERLLNRLNKRCDLVLVAINDPADKAICPVGTVLFQASDFDKAYVNTDSMIGQKAYAKQWKENRCKLHEITSKVKVPTIELTTEADIARDLVFGLRRIGRGSCKTLI